MPCASSRIAPGSAPISFCGSWTPTCTGRHHTERQSKLRRACPAGAIKPATPSSIGTRPLRGPATSLTMWRPSRILSGCSIYYIRRRALRMFDGLYRGNRRRRLGTLLVALGLAATVGATASIAAKTPSAAPTLKINPIFAYNKADREAHLYACAKQEGSLTLYTSSSATQPSLVPAFQAAYPGVTVNAYVATAALVPKLVQEEDSGHHNFDVYNDTMGNLDRNSKYFQPFWSPYMKTVQPDLTSPYFLGSNGFIFAGVYYNPNVVAPSDVPKTWKDLLNPNLKGKIYIGTDSSAPIVTALLRRTYGTAYYAQLAKQVHVVNTSGRGVADMIIAGTAPMGIEMSSSYYKTNTILQNAPLKLQVINPMFGAYQASSIS